MTSEKRRRNSILITRHYPDLGSASDWSCRVGNLIQAIKNTTQIWVVTRFCARFSDVIWRGNQWLHRQMSSVVSGCFYTIFFEKTLWQKLSVDKSLSFLQSHVPLNSSICQSEEGLNLFSPEPFWLFISCLHDDAYLSTIVIKEQIKKFVCPWHNNANRFNFKHRRDLDQFKIQSCYLKNHCQKVTTNV